jgi:hypothetical protein
MVTLRDMINPYRRTGPAIEPFDYNPSSWGQRVPIALLAMAGFFIAVYLGLYQWGLIAGLWEPFFTGEGERNGSETVVMSDASERMKSWFRIPDAMLGAVAYLGDAVFCLAGSTRRWQYRPWMVAIFGLDVIPLGIVGAILVFVQGFVVGYWCTLCLASAAISLILVWLAYDEVWASLLYLYRVWKRTRRSTDVWQAFCGIPNQAAYEVGEEMIRR